LSGERAAVWPRFARAGLGLALVALAVLASPWSLERFVLLDHRLTQPVPVLLVDLALVGVGVRLIATAWRAPRGARAGTRPARHTVLFALAAAASASALTLGAAEIALRAFLGPERVLRGDARWERRWRAAHAAGAPAESAAGAYAFDRYDPSLGWRPKAGFRSDDVRTNSLGIRADREHAVERDARLARVVLVGDSFTWGETVRNEECLAAVLEGLLPGAEVLNLGVHGYGTDQQLLYLRALGLSLAPDLVVLGFFDEDINRNVLAFRDYAKPRFRLAADGRLALGNVPVPSPDSLLARPQRLPRSYVAEIARAAWDRLLDRTVLRPLERSERWLVTREILATARRETEARGARFLLLYIPVGITPEAHGAERAVVAWADSTGTDLVNLREEFLRLPAEERGAIYGTTHWSPLGNRRAAEAVRDAIATRGLLPARRPGSPPPPPRAPIPRPSAAS
jgi:hypothetical protein